MSWTDLHEAALRGDIGKAKAILQAGKDVLNAKDSYEGLHSIFPVLFQVGMVSWMLRGSFSIAMPMLMQ